MKKIILFLTVTMSLMAWDTAKVVSVSDGDTLWLKKGTAKAFKVRLVGLDTFETKMSDFTKHRVFKQLQTLKDIHPFEKHSVREVLFWGYKAKEFVTKKILYKQVKYHYYKDDQYGRPLVYIKNINYLLIRYGLAVQYPTNLLHPKRKAFLLEASRSANLERRGIYAREK